IRGRDFSMRCFDGIERAREPANVRPGSPQQSKLAARGSTVADQGDSSCLEVGANRQETHLTISASLENNFVDNTGAYAFGRTKFYQRCHRSWHKPCSALRVSRRFMSFGHEARRIRGEPA